jgi:hypothetical protein
MISERLHIVRQRWIGHRDHRQRQPTDGDHPDHQRRPDLPLIGQHSLNNLAPGDDRGGGDVCGLVVLEREPIVPCGRTAVAAR